MSANNVDRECGNVNNDVNNVNPLVNNDEMGSQNHVQPLPLNQQLIPLWPNLNSMENEENMNNEAKDI